MGRHRKEAADSEPRVAAAGTTAARLGPGLTVVVALLAYAWVLVLPFQLDDYSQVSGAPGQLGFFSRAVETDLLGSDQAPAQGDYIFRPTIWLSFVTDWAISGEPLDPVVFHASSLLIHVLTALAVWYLLVRLLPPSGALLGALFFALHPAGAQAISWVAARGDLFTTLFGVLAMLAALGVSGPGGSGRWIRSGHLVGTALVGACLVWLLALVGVVVVAGTGASAAEFLARRWWVAGAAGLLGLMAGLGVHDLAAPQKPGRAFLAGLFLALAILSKMPAYVLVPVVLGCVAFRPGLDRRRRLTAVLLVAAFALTAFSLRWWYVGTPRPVYAGNSSFTFEALGRMSLVAPHLVLQLIAPWNLDPALAQVGAGVASILREMTGAGLASRTMVNPSTFVPLDPAQALAAVPVLLLLLAALLAAPRWFGKRFLTWLVVFGIIATPPLFLFRPDTGTSLSRAFYPVMVPFAWLIGGSFAALWRCSGAGRRAARFVACTCILGVGVVSVDGLVHVIRRELLVAGHIEQRLEAVEAALAEVGPEGLVVVIDPESGIGGIPLLNILVQPAFRPPYRAVAGNVVHRQDQEHLVTSRLLSEDPSPTVLLVLREGRLVRTGPLLPGSTGPLPPLVIRDDAWVPRDPVAPRYVRALRVPLEPGPEVSLDLVLETDTARLERRLVAPADAGPREAVIGLDEDPLWLLGTALRRVQVRTAEGGQAPIRAAPELLAGLPALELLDPPPGEQIELNGPREFRVRGVPPGSTLEAHLDFIWEPERFSMTAVIPPERQVRRGQDVVFWLGTGETVRTPHAGLRWEALPRLFDEYARTHGVGSVAVAWWVRSSQGDTLTGRSASSGFSVTK